MNPHFARQLAALAGIGCAAVLSACTHAMPAGTNADGTAAGGDDPWVTRGSVEAGPIYGKPIGPYSPR